VKEHNAAWDAVCQDKDTLTMSSGRPPVEPWLLDP
jgi:hypothetical protein